MVIINYLSETTMLSLLFAFTASLTYGTGDYVAGQTARRVPTPLIVLMTQGTQAVLVLGMALFSGQPFLLAAFGWGLLGGFANGTGYILYYRALTLGPVGVIAPLVASGSVLPVVVSLVQGAIPNGLILGGLGAVLAGVLFITYAPVMPVLAGITPDQGVGQSWLRFVPTTCVLLALASALGFGIAFVVGDHGISIAGEQLIWLIWGFQLGTLPASLTALLTSGENKVSTLSQRSVLRLLGLIMVLNMAGDFLVAYALGQGVLGIVSVLASLAPVVTTLLATVLLHERLTSRQTLGAALTVLGTLIVAAGG